MGVFFSLFFCARWLTRNLHRLRKSRQLDDLSVLFQRRAGEEDPPGHPVKHPLAVVGAPCGRVEPTPMARRGRQRTQSAPAHKMDRRRPGHPDRLLGNSLVGGGRRCVPLVCCLLHRPRCSACKRSSGMTDLNAGSRHFGSRSSRWLDPRLVAEVLARASFGENEHDVSPRSRRRVPSRADPPRLVGWMSLSRIAQTADVSLSPHWHRQSGSNPNPS